MGGDEDRVAGRRSSRSPRAPPRSSSACSACACRISAARKGLGPVGALGIVGAFVASLTFLPAVLLLIGRRDLLARQVPQVDHVHSADAVGTRGIWGRVAGMVGRHPRRTWVVTLARARDLRGVPADAQRPGHRPVGPLPHDQVDSVTGQEVLARHFPAGSGSPVQIAAPEGKADAVVAGARVHRRREQPAGRSRARPAAQGRRRPGHRAGDARRGGRQRGGRGRPSRRSAPRLDRVGSDVLVGGTTATNLDVRLASERDLKVIIPTILAVIFVVLHAPAAVDRGPARPRRRERPVVRRDHGRLGHRLQPRLRLPGVRPVDAALRLRLPRRPRASTTRSSS